MITTTLSEVRLKPYGEEGRGNIPTPEESNKTNRGGKTNGTYTDKLGKNDDEISLAVRW